MSTAHESSGKPADPVKCCVMDYLLMQGIFPDSLTTENSLFPPTAQENMGNWSFPWRGDTFEQDPSWGKEPMCLSLLLCQGSGKQLPAGPRASMDTVPKEKSRGQQHRGFGMCWFLWVFMRKAVSYCFWWVLNCSMDCSMALNGPYPEAALGSIRSRIHAFLSVFLIPTQAFWAQAVTLNKTTRDCKCHSLLIYLLSLSLPKMWK